MNISHKKIIILFLSLSIFAVVHYLFLQSMHSGKVKQQGTPAFRVAIFEPATHPAINEIAQGFIDEADRSDKKYACTRYNANGNKILMYAQAQEMLQKKYDLIFTIGVGCSVAAKELSAKQNDQTPLVFSAVDLPEKFNLQGPNVTGVVDHTNYLEQLKLVLKLQPSIKNILLVYDVSQGSGLEKDKEEIKSILQSENVDLRSVEISALGEIQQKVTAFMDETDLVMILKDSTIVSGIDTLIKLCQKYQVPLLATDLNSGMKGAALAYGIHEGDCGVQGALQAKLILEQGQTPGHVPVVQVDKMVMKINRKQAAMQGLDLDLDKITALNIELD